MDEIEKTLIDDTEPKGFEKSIIRNLITDIEAFASQPDLAASIRKFASDAKFDVFAAFENSPHENVQDVGHMLLQDTVKIAVDAAQSVVRFLKMYIDKSPDVKAEQRGEILSEFIVSKELFKQKNGTDYDQMPDIDRAIMHGRAIVKLVDTVVQALLMDIAGGIKYLPPWQAEAIFIRREINYPLLQRPQLVGLIFTHNSIDQFITQRAAILYDMNQQQAETEIKELRQECAADLSRPFPGLFSGKKHGLEENRYH